MLLHFLYLLPHPPTPTPIRTTPSPPPILLFVSLFSSFSSFLLTQQICGTQLIKSSMECALGYFNLFILLCRSSSSSGINVKWRACLYVMFYMHMCARSCVCVCVLRNRFWSCFFFFFFIKSTVAVWVCECVFYICVPACTCPRARVGYQRILLMQLSLSMP